MLAATDTPMSVFAETIMHNKRYSHPVNGRRETWPEIAARVTHNVVKPYLPDMSERITQRISSRQVIPGGRYLYAAGRKYHQINSCFLFRAQDSKEGWGDLADKCVVSLMTGGGIGVVYTPIRAEGEPVEGLGGTCTGPCSLAGGINEFGRRIMQGGSRRSAIWAGLHWYHKDIFKLIHLKDWPDAVKELKAKDYTFPAEMDMTNISVILDSAFFAAYHNPSDPMHYWAWRVYWEAVESMLKTGEPGFSVNVGPNEAEDERNAPVHGDTRVLTYEGYQRVADLVDTPAIIWTGKQWATDVVFKKTGDNVPTVKVQMTGGREIVCDPSHPFLVETYSRKGIQRYGESTVTRVPASELEEGDIISVSLPHPEVNGVDNAAYTFGFIYGDGSFVGRNRAEVTICSKSKEPCAARFIGLSHKRSWDCTRNFWRYYFDPNDIFYGRNKETLSIDGSYEYITSFLAGLFDADGNWESTQHRVRLSSVRLGFLQSTARLLETVGILSHITSIGPSGYGSEQCWQLVVAADSVARFAKIIPTLRLNINTDGWTPYRKSTVKVLSITQAEPADVYCCDVGEEEHSFCAEGVIISNCTEVTSADDSDMCNLVSLNMARFDRLEDFHDAVNEAVALQMCGSIYSKLPTEKMYKVREKNRRLGLGLMGIHEWLLKRNYRYGPCKELGEWLSAYTLSGVFANAWADRMSVSRSAGTRAIAPNGTIGIVAETTGGMEPITCTAYYRLYLEGTNFKAQYVLDATTKRLVDQGVDPEGIEDAYTLAEDVERRIEFQAWLQQYVDHSISSTINLPEWGSSVNNPSTVRSFGDKLMKHLPKLRGITTYPDGARSGQPITKVPYTEAVKQLGVIFDGGSEDSCKGGVCGA